MKIMIVTPYFYPRVGGLENYALNTAKALRKKGHEVFVVASNHTTKHRVDEKVQDLRVVRLPRMLKLSNTPINPFWRWQLKSIVKTERPDVINAHTPVPYIADMAARAAGRTPFVLTYHNDLAKPSFVGNILARAFYILLSRRTMRRSDQIIATSEYYVTISPYLQKYTGKVSIVSPGVDLDKFNSSVDKKWLKQKYIDKKIVLFVGSMKKTHAHKGVDILIRAIAKIKSTIPNIQLVAVGPGDAVVEYKELAHELGIANSVDFPGFVTDEDLPKYYAGADVFVLPSTTDAEGFGMVIAEAQACGTPVIGSNVGGISFAINDNKTGALVEPRNIDDLASKITSTLSIKPKKQIDNAARVVLEKFTWTKTAMDTVAVLRKATAPKICIIHNIIAPYRLPVFEAMQQHANVSVIFCKALTKDRVWDYDLDRYSFAYKVLKGFAIGPVIINPAGWLAIMRTNFDVLICNNDPDVASIALPGYLLAKLKKAKILSWSEVSDDAVHTLTSERSASRTLNIGLVNSIRLVIRFYRSVIIKLSDRCIAFTPAAVRFLLKNGVAKEKVTLTQTVMPLSSLPSASKSAYAERTGKKFLYIGYFTERKGIDLLIKAFRQLPDPDAVLTIAGTGPIKNKLVLLAGDDKRIVFRGHIDGAAKADLYAASDIFVLPTLHDVWGLVINEAIHYGLAVVCSSAAEAKILVGDKNGCVFESQNTEALKGCLQSLIGNRNRVMAMQHYNLRYSLPNETDLANEILDAVRACYEE